jgi:hypothetical protein
MKKLTIWIFDDELRGLKKAQEAVTQVADRLSYSFEVQPITNWAWPSKEQHVSNLPDILILDLVEEGVLRGKAVYDELRKQEKIKKRPPAFVAIWSGRWDNPAAVSFVEQLRVSDPFMYDLQVKDKYKLADVVEGFVKRIQEEWMA